MSSRGRIEAPPHAQGVFDLDDMRQLLGEFEDSIMKRVDERLCRTEGKVDKLAATVEKHSQKFAHEEGADEARRDFQGVVQRWLGWLVAGATVAVSLFHPHLG